MLTNQIVTSYRGIITPDILVSFAAFILHLFHFLSFTCMKTKENPKPHVVAHSLNRTDLPPTVWIQEVFLLLLLLALFAPLNEVWQACLQGLTCAGASVISCVMWCVCCRSTRSASRSTCPTGLKSTTTKVPLSVNTVVLCCGGSPSRGSNVRVRGGSFMISVVLCT